jgi:hypothetical protein
MGNNGQQLQIYLPSGPGKVRVSGTNQNGQTVTWDGVAAQGLENFYGVVTQTNGVGWWWKGDAQVWWNDSAGQTHTFKVRNIPVQQLQDIVYCWPPGHKPPGF